jgi:hypothetical protein
VVHQPRPQLIGMQADVLGHTLRDGEPHSVRRQHQRPVPGERPPDRTQQRMHPIRLQHRQVRIAAGCQHLSGKLSQPPRRQPGPHSGNVINPENRHGQTISRQAAAQKARGEPGTLQNIRICRRLIREGIRSFTTPNGGSRSRDRRLGDTSLRGPQPA